MNSLWYVPCNSKDAMIEDYEIAVPLNVKNDEPVDAKLFWQGPRKAWLKLSGKFVQIFDVLMTYFYFQCCFVLLGVTPDTVFVK